jgi:hypothetical protein
MKAAGITAGDLNNFKFYAQHAAAAYCNVLTPAGQKIQCGGNACPALQGNAVTVVASFRYTPLSLACKAPHETYNTLNSGSSTGIGGYVATDNARKEIVVSIRGSSNIRNWIANVDFLQTPCSLVADCYVHTGFQNAWVEIGAAVKTAVKAARKANPSYKIVSAGHSLGGAVATLAATYLRVDGYAVDLFTYGSPRVGNEAFANFVSAQAGLEWRITHGDDPVPRLPPIIFGYRHTTPEYWLDGGSLDIDYALDEIVVCAGSANVNCNGGTFGLDILAHLRYLQDVSACAPIGIFWRDNVSDEELEARLNDYTRKDKAFVKTLDGGK